MVAEVSYTWIYLNTRNESKLRIIINASRNRLPKKRLIILRELLVCRWYPFTWLNWKHKNMNIQVFCIKRSASAKYRYITCRRKSHNLMHRYVSETSFDIISISPRSRSLWLPESGSSSTYLQLLCRFNILLNIKRAPWYIFAIPSIRAHPSIDKKKIFVLMGT